MSKTMVLCHTVWLWLTLALGGLSCGHLMGGDPALWPLIGLYFSGLTMGLQIMWMLVWLPVAYGQGQEE